MTVKSQILSWHDLPDRAQIEALWDKYEMPLNIRQHSRVVRDVAVLLGSWLQVKGLELNAAALNAGGLLHDIAKIVSLRDPSKIHHLEGEKILLAEGLPDLAYLVRYHVGLVDDFKLDEVALVFYADKRVQGDKVVDLASRFAYILDRYGKNNPERMERLLQGQRQAFQVEDMIFKMLPEHRPDEVVNYLEEKSL